MCGHAEIRVEIDTSVIISYRSSPHQSFFFSNLNIFYFSLRAKLNRQLACQFFSANHLSYRTDSDIVRPSVFAVQ